MAVVDRTTGQRWSYAVLDQLIDRWATWLRATSIGAGARVGVLARNRVEHVALYFACARIGAALVPLNWRLTSAELDRVLAHAALDLLLIGREVGTRADAVGLDDVIVPSAREVRTEPAPLSPLPTSAADDIAMLLHTSGSTGEPKAAVLTHGQLLANALATADAWQLSARDVATVATPLFHTAAWHAFATPLWTVGGTVVLLDGFEPDRLLGTMAEEGSTHAFLVPTQLQMLTECAAWGRALPSLRWFLCGGAALPATLARTVRAAGYPLRFALGMTEFGPNCFWQTDALIDEATDAVGWLVPGVEARVVGASGASLPEGDVGELWLRGPQRFAGYFRDADRTAAVITADGWYRTGDLVTRDATGLFRIRGRQSDRYTSGGEHIWPGEVEAALVACAGVRDAAVIAAPDPTWGEVGVAFVVFAEGAPADLSGLEAAVRERLAGYKVPRRWRVLADLPRLGSGKPDRGALRELLRG